MEPEQNTTNSIIKKGVMGTLALLLVAGVGIYLSQEKNKREDTTNNEVAVENDATVPPTPTTEQAGAQPSADGISLAFGYKDGTYQATGKYASPAGMETVNISLTLTGDTVTAATFKGDATNPGSINWQGKFSEGFSQAVVGKDIDSLSLSIVNGSSLTPKGFADALVKIKAEAKI